MLESILAIYTTGVTTDSKVTTMETGVTFQGILISKVGIFLYGDGLGVVRCSPTRPCRADDAIATEIIILQRAS